MKGKHGCRETQWSQNKRDNHTVRMLIPKHAWMHINGMWFTRMLIKKPHRDDNLKVIKNPIINIDFSKLHGWAINDVLYFLNKVKFEIVSNN